MERFDFYAFLPERETIVDALPGEWFKVPYRSKEEGLRVAFGDEWSITYVPLDVGFALDGYLLSHSDCGAQMMCVFQDNERDWYNSAFAPENLVPGEPAHRFRGRVRERRATLKRHITNVRTAPDLATMIANYADLTIRGVNPQAYAYVPALFQVWLDTEGITGAERDAENMLAGLSNYQSAIEMINARTTKNLINA